MTDLQINPLSEVWNFIKNRSNFDVFDGYNHRINYMRTCSAWGDWCCTILTGLGFLVRPRTGCPSGDVSKAPHPPGIPGTRREADVLSVCREPLRLSNPNAATSGSRTILGGSFVIVEGGGTRFDTAAAVPARIPLSTNGVRAVPSAGYRQMDIVERSSSTSEAAREEQDGEDRQ